MDIFFTFVFSDNFIISFIKEENAKKILTLYSLGLINGLINSDLKFNDEYKGLVILPNWEKGDIIDLFLSNWGSNSYGKYSLNYKYNN